MLVRKLAATTSLMLGLVMLFFSGPSLAGAAVDAVSVPPADLAAAADDPTAPTGVPTGVPTDPPTTPSPTTPTPTTPSPTTPSPTTPSPTTPTPTVPSDPGPSVPVPTPTTPTGPPPTFSPIDPIGGTSGSRPGRGQVDEDEGTTDPGADESDEQGEKTSAEDPALGNPAAPQAVAADAAAPQEAALPDTGADGNLPWLALLGVALTVFGGALLKRPHMARHRA